MHGYRTLILVALTELFSLWEGTAPAGVIPLEWIPFATGAFGIAFGVLRFMTTGPVGGTTPVGGSKPTVRAYGPVIPRPPLVIEDDPEVD